MIKIIEYVQEIFFFGIEFFGLEMHITSMMWYLYILMRKIVNESQRTEFKGL